MFQTLQQKTFLGSNMNNFEIKSILDSMEIIVDTREQATHIASSRYEAPGVPYYRQTMNYGDYTYNVVIDGEKLHRSDMRVNGLCVVERKQNLDELAACFTRGRERFEREFQRAGDYNAKVYLLVENASLDLLMAGQYRSKFRPKAFLASLMAFEVRYNITTLFCESKNSGALIREVLYRDIKERLERGEFG
jgi:ERCC4-type nuclease